MKASVDAIPATSVPQIRSMEHIGHRQQTDVRQHPDMLAGRLHAAVGSESREATRAARDEVHVRAQPDNACTTDGGSKLHTSVADVEHAGRPTGMHKSVMNQPTKAAPVNSEVQNKLSVPTGDTALKPTIMEFESDAQLPTALQANEQRKVVEKHGSNSVVNPVGNSAIISTSQSTVHVENPVLHSGANPVLNTGSKPSLNPDVHAGVNSSGTGVNVGANSGVLRRVKTESAALTGVLQPTVMSPREYLERQKRERLKHAGQASVNSIQNVVQVKNAEVTADRSLPSGLHTTDSRVADADRSEFQQHENIFDQLKVERSLLDDAAIDSSKAVMAGDTSSNKIRRSSNDAKVRNVDLSKIGRIIDEHKVEQPAAQFISATQPAVKTKQPTDVKMESSSKHRTHGVKKSATGHNDSGRMKHSISHMPKHKSELVKAKSDTNADSLFHATEDSARSACVESKEELNAVSNNVKCERVGDVSSMDNTADSRVKNSECVTSSGSEVESSQTRSSEIVSKARMHRKLPPSLQGNNETTTVVTPNTLSSDSRSDMLTAKHDAATNQAVVVLSRVEDLDIEKLLCPEHVHGNANLGITSVLSHGTVAERRQLRKSQDQRCSHRNNASVSLDRPVNTAGPMTSPTKPQPDRHEHTTPRRDRRRSIDEHADDASKSGSRRRRSPATSSGPIALPGQTQIVAPISLPAILPDVLQISNATTLPSAPLSSADVASYASDSVSKAQIRRDKSSIAVEDASQVDADDHLNVVSTSLGSTERSQNTTNAVVPVQASDVVRSSTAGMDDVLSGMHTVPSLKLKLRRTETTSHHAMSDTNMPTPPMKVLVKSAAALTPALDSSMRPSSSAEYAADDIAPTSLSPSSLVQTPSLKMRLKLSGTSGQVTAIGDQGIVQTALDTTPQAFTNPMKLVLSKDRISGNYQPDAGRHRHHHRDHHRHHHSKSTTGAPGDVRSSSGRKRVHTEELSRHHRLDDNDVPPPLPPPLKIQRLVGNEHQSGAVHRVRNELAVMTGSSTEQTVYRQRPTNPPPPPVADSPPPPPPPLPL